MSSIESLELKSFTKLQKELHTVPDNNTSELASNFTKEFVKTSWYSHTPVKMNAVVKGDLVTFDVNTVDYHFLLYTYLRQRLPAVAVKEKYRGKVLIAWCHNVGVNVVKNAYWKINDKTVSSFDNGWLDIYFQYYRKAGQDKIFQFLGNLPFLEDWSSYLPPYTTNVPQPWSYSSDSSMAVPLCLFDPNSALKSMTHEYSVRTNVTDLLRMKIRKDSSEDWKDIPCNLEYINLSYGDQRPKDRPESHLCDPELWARYAQITKDELQFHTCDNEKIYYINDVVKYTSVNAESYGKVVEFTLDDPDQCRALFYVSQNTKAEEINNYSNYTTKLDHSSAVVVPIKLVLLLRVRLTAAFELRAHS